MADFIERDGNIFRTTGSAIVITVNCEGVMGAGIALDAKLRWPPVFERYRAACENGEVAIGRNLLVTRQSAELDVICFPTKHRWRNPSKLSYIRDGLVDLRRIVDQTAIPSIALPHLGCSHGGLRWPQVEPLIVQAFDGAPSLTVELWRFEEELDDPDFARLRDLVAMNSPADLGRRLGLRLSQAEALAGALRLTSVRGLSSLQRVPGIGEKSLSAVYRYLFHPNTEPEQTELLL